MNTPEQARLFTFQQLNLLDTPPSESLDRITRLASQLSALLEFHSTGDALQRRTRDTDTISRLIIICNNAMPYFITYRT